MKTFFVEKDADSQRVYDSMLLNPASLGIFSNGLSVRIISEIARKPQCAMDVAKKLRIHEQKVYYYLRKFRDSGIVHMTREESRYGMTAKIFSIVSPVIAAKLHEDGYDLKEKIHIKNQQLEEFLKPFIAGGRLNAKIIIGDPYPHGPYDEAATDGAYVIDLGLFLGKFFSLSGTSYKLDTETVENDLKENLILIGNARRNLVVNKINPYLPAYFDENGCIVSKSTKKVYSDARNGVIIKTINPFNKHKKILVLGGVRGRGTRAAILAFTLSTDETIKIQDENGMSARIVEGIDKDGDRVIDHVKFVE